MRLQKSHTPPRNTWKQYKDAPATLAIAMAAIAIVFIIGIVTAFDNARLDSIAHQEPPVQTAHAPNATTVPAPPATTGSGIRNQPAPQNTKP